MLLILWLFERDDIFGRYRIETSYGSVIEASQRKLGATDRPDLRVWRHSSTLPTRGGHPRGRPLSSGKGRVGAGGILRVACE